MVQVGDDGLIRSYEILHSKENMKLLRRHVGMGDCRAGGIGHRLSSSGRMEVSGCRSGSFVGLLTGSRGSLLVAASNFCVK